MLVGRGRPTRWFAWRKFRFDRMFKSIRSKRFATPMGSGRILCSVLGRYKMFVDADDHDISPHLIMDGFWERHVSSVMIERLRPGMVAIDVGANLGYFSLLMAILCGRDGHVLAFEPSPRSYAFLTDNIAINGLAGRIRPHDCALAEADDREVILAVSHHHPAGAQITTLPGEGMVQHVVRTRRLDSIAGAQDATLIKIDTEGLEEAVWRGMSALLASRRLRYIIIEFTRLSYHSAIDMLDEAVAHGFALYRIDEDSRLVATNRDEIMAGSIFQMLLLER